MFSPSEYPSCRMPPRKLSRSRRYAASEPAMSTAIRGRLSAGCCARAASGHDAAAPPRSVMNSRRFNAWCLRASNRKDSTRRRRGTRCAAGFQSGLRHQRPNGDLRVEAVPLPTADIARRGWHGRKVPTAVFAAVRRTGVTECLPNGCVLVRLDVRRPDHLAPLLSLLGDKFAEAGPRKNKDRHTGFSKPRHDIRIGESGIDLAMELVHDLKRCISGSDDATPPACLEASKGICDPRNVWKFR